MKLFENIIREVFKPYNQLKLILNFILIKFC
jgi:hypothetical protein